jgi:copper(I)-binding protein
MHGAKLERLPGQGDFVGPWGRLRLTRMKIVAAAFWALLAASAGAHDFRTGSLVIDHPYAVDGGRSIHFRALKNEGSAPDRLIGATSAVLGPMELRNGDVPAPLILAARSEVPFRHDGPWRLSFGESRASLKAGEQLQVTLHFQHAPDLTVPVRVVDSSARHTH